MEAWRHGDMEAIPIGAVEYVCVGLGDYYERPANNGYPWSLIFYILLLFILRKRQCCFKDHYPSLDMI